MNTIVKNAVYTSIFGSTQSITSFEATNTQEEVAITHDNTAVIMSAESKMESIAPQDTYMSA